MLAMLRSIRDHGRAEHHLRGNSQFGGAGQTMSAIRAAGWVVMATSTEEKDRLTVRGQQILLIHDT
jgi:hypothetical protein